MITDGTRIWGTFSSTQREVLLNCSSSETNASRLSGVMPTDSRRCSKAGSTGSDAKAFCAPDVAEMRLITSPKVASTMVRITGHWLNRMKRACRTSMAVDCNPLPRAPPGSGWLD